MPGLVPGIHVFLQVLQDKDVDGRDKPGHDDEKNVEDTMGFKCGIVGLPNVGKSTLFNALTETAAAQQDSQPMNEVLRQLFNR